jgi:hypothetical protein
VLDTHGLKYLSAIARKRQTLFRNGSISIGFGWNRMQKEREDMPGGPCHGPEAWKANWRSKWPMFQSHNTTIFDRKTNALGDMSPHPLDLDEMGCRKR